MPETPPPVDLLSVILLEVLSRIPDRTFAARLRRVYVAAAHAIRGLSDMDLISYETPVTDASPDLSLWEEMAPVIRDTVMDVNALLTVIRQQFPLPTPGGIADTLSQAIEEAGDRPGPTTPEERTREAEGVLQRICQQIAQQVTHLGERMRSPQVVSDRWNLLADLQAFRSRFRELIGDLVYLTSSAFAEVHRKDVVPGYREEVRAAVTIRATVMDLFRLMTSRAIKIDEALPEDVQWYGQQLEKDLDAFGRTPAYKALRAQDKRQVIEFRHAVRQLALKAAPPKAELLALFKPFVLLLEALNKVNNREVLITHDREAWAACGVLLEKAEPLAGSDPPQAAAVLTEATGLAQELYGREPKLDAFLRKVKKTPWGGLDAEALRAELNTFRELLGQLPML